MRARHVVVAVSLSLLAAGCAAMSARSAFTRGEKARQQGKVEEAIGAYEQAAKGDPKKPEYKRALEETRAQAVAARVEAAQSAEARGDLSRAVKEWDAALGHRPGDAELSARRELAILKARQADPVEYHAAAAKLVAARPDDPSAAQLHAQASAAAVAHHLRLADTYAEAKAWPRAHLAFDAAKAIDPQHAVFKGPQYKLAESRYLEGLGDERAKAGDPVGAFHAYEKAVALKSSPTLDGKLRTAKRSAGPVLEQYEQAKAAEQKGQWEEAADLYTFVASRPAAPADVPARAARARSESARLRAARAKGYAEKGLAEKATAELALALEHTDGPPDALTAMSGALEALGAGRVGEASEAFARARAAGPGVPVIEVAPDVLGLVVKAGFAEAKRQAEASPAEALLALRRLEPFASKLEGYAALRERLIKRAFGALVDAAEKAGAEQRWDAAAERLAAALEVSKPPASLAEPLRAGSAALTKHEWGAARAAFERAFEASQSKSSLARVGKKVALAAHLAELRKDAAAARTGGDSFRAAAAYRAILELDPEDAEAKAGAAALRGALVAGALRAAKASEAEGKLGAAYVYHRRVAALDPQEPDARAALSALGKQLAGPEEPTALVAPVVRLEQLGAACEGAEKELRKQLVFYLGKERKLGAEYLKKDDVASVDEGKRPTPPVVLAVTLEGCTPTPKDGAMRASLELRLGAQVLAKEQANAKLDLEGIPKDELADGLPPKRVETLLVNEAAKAVRNALARHAAKLSGWRSASAEAALAAGDVEAAARAYAALVESRASAEADKKALRALELFLTDRLR